MNQRARIDRSCAKAFVKQSVYVCLFHAWAWFQFLSFGKPWKTCSAYFTGMQHKQILKHIFLLYRKPVYS